MGCAVSQEDRAANKRTKELDEVIKTEKALRDRSVKLLLLGAGESGKSTVLKQVKILHDKGFSDEDRVQLKDTIYTNVKDAALDILTGMKATGISFQDEAVKIESEKIFEFEYKTAMIVTEEPYISILRKVWADPGVKSAYIRRREFQIGDSAAYYFDNLERIAAVEYIPTDEDILRSRVKTIGITEARFHYTAKNLDFRIFDVGGQRSERKKWIHCFENVTGIIFCAALSAYDTMLLEDNETNRMHESLKLFDSVANSRWFSQSAIILLLNKIDLFMDKITKVPLSVCFPDYEGCNEFHEAVQYIRDQYEVLNRTPQRNQIYTHLTCATDTENVRFVLDAVTDIVIQARMRDTGYL
eukprot:CFRG3440T1